MSKPVFNPEDFVFQKLELPEDNPTLIEYDAKARLIYVRVVNPATKEYEYQAVHLNETVNKNLLEYLPDEWSNENDRITLFAVHQNGKFILEKEKLKYNFDTKETYWVNYSYKNFTKEDAKELFEALKAAVFVHNTNEETKQYEQLISIARKQQFLDSMYLEILSTSQRMLRQTDWRILPDAPESFSGEKDLWIKWREFVRNSPKKPEEFELEIDFLLYKEELKWPINPEQYHSKYPSGDGSDYLETAEQFVSYETHLDTSEAVNTVNAKLRVALNEYLRAKEGGVPIKKEMYDIIQKYCLLNNIEDFPKFTVGEES